MQLSLTSGLAGFVGQSEPGGVYAKQQYTFWVILRFLLLRSNDGDLSTKIKEKETVREVMFKARDMSFLFGTSSN